MTQAEAVYIETLNLFGSDPLPPDIQKIVDAEHAAASPAFAKTLLSRVPAPRQPAE